MIPVRVSGQVTITCFHHCGHLNADGLGTDERIKRGLSNYVAHRFLSNKLITAAETDEAWIMRRIRASVGIALHVNIELIPRKSEAFVRGNLTGKPRVNSSQRTTIKIDARLGVFMK